LENKWKILVRLPAILLTLLLSGVLLLQTPEFQTRIVRKVTVALDSTLNGRARVGSIKIQPFCIISIKDLVLDGNDPADTVCRIDNLTATFSIRGLLTGDCLQLGRVHIDGGFFNLETRQGNRIPTNIQRLFNIVPKRKELPKGGPDIFSMRRLKMDNFTFRMKIVRAPDRPKHVYKGVGINWDDLEVRDISIRGHNVSMKNGRVSGVLDRLSGREKSGFNIHRLKGRVVTGCGKTVVENIRLLDDFSDLRVPRYVMHYANIKDFSHYVDAVRMEITVARSKVDLRSAAYFSPGLWGDPLFFDVKDAFIEGYTSDLRVKKLVFNEKNSAVSGSLSCDFLGLGKGRNDAVLIDGKIGALRFNFHQLERFLSGLSHGKRIPAIKKLSKKPYWVLSGTAKGPLDRLLTNVTLSSRQAGDLHANLDIRNATSLQKRPLELSGSISTKSLNVGQIINNDKIGRITMNTRARAVTGKGKPSCIIESLEVNSVEALGMQLQNIALSGRLKDGKADGTVTIDDDKVKLALEGAYPAGNDKKDLPNFILSGTIGHADLAALGLEERTGISAASLGLDIKPGNMSISDIRITMAGENLDLGDLSLVTEKIGGMYSTDLKSSIATGRFTGSTQIGDLFGALAAVSTDRHLPASKKKQHLYKEGSFYSLNLNLLDTHNLLGAFIPGLYIAAGTTLDCKISSRGVLETTLKSQRIAKGLNFVKNIDATLRSDSTLMSLELTGNEINIKGSSVKTIHLGAGAKQNSLRAELDMKGEGSSNAGGTLLLNSAFRRNPENNSLGAGFDLRNNDSTLFISGDLSKSPSDSVLIDIKDVDLSILNSFSTDDLGIGGKASGHARIDTPFGGAFRMAANFSLDSLLSAGKPVGSLKAVCGWDNEGSQLNLYSTAEGPSGEQTFTLAGHLIPKTGNIDCKALFDGFNLSAAAPALAGSVKDLKGTLSGRVDIGGTLKKMDISTDGLTLSKASAKIAATGVTYILDGVVKLDSAGAYLDGLSISDELNGHGTLSGKVSFAGLPKGVVLDTKLSTSNLQVLNITASDPRNLRGTLYADSDVSISGGLDNIVVQGKVITAESGNVHIATGSSTATEGSGLLTFEEEVIENEDRTYRQASSKNAETTKKKSNLTLDMEVSIKEQTEGVIELGRSSGSTLAVRGNGDIHLYSTPKGIALMTGDYQITGGKYHFTLPGAMITKDFSIQNGSTIKLGSDLKSASININAIYSLKASLATLLSDTKADSRRNVECGINIKGTLDALDFGFKVNIPDLDPTTQSRVDIALNTEDKMQKQFMALLIMGTFLPDEASGIVNGSNVLYSNVTEIMSGQFNSVLERLGIPLDLGLGYEQNSRGTDIFDVAISTELFNKRVVINGNVGNRDNALSGSSQSTVVGDVDIEVKVDRPGTFRVKAFSHSADEHTSFLDSSQRNGVGLTYQRDYDNFWQFLKYVFSSKAKKEEMTRQNLEKQKNLKETVLSSR